MPWLLWQPQGPIDLQLVNDYHHYNSFSFNQMFLKLANNMDMDKILDELKQLGTSDH